MGREGEGVDGCVVRRSEWVWGVRPGFCFSNLQVFSQLLIVLSAVGWGLVAGDGFQAFPH